MSSAYPYRRAVVIDDRPVRKTLTEAIERELAAEDPSNGDAVEPLLWEEDIVGVVRDLLMGDTGAGSALARVKQAFTVQAQRRTAPAMPDPDHLAGALLDAIGLDPDDVENSVDLTPFKETGRQIPALSAILGEAEDRYTEAELREELTEKLGDRASACRTLGDLWDLVALHSEALDAWDDAAGMEENATDPDTIKKFGKGLETFLAGVSPDEDEGDGWVAIRGGEKTARAYGQKCLAAVREEIQEERSLREEALSRLRTRLLGATEGTVTLDDVEQMLGILGDEPEF